MMTDLEMKDRAWAYVLDCIKDMTVQPSNEQIVKAVGAVEANTRKLIRALEPRR